MKSGHQSKTNYQLMMTIFGKKSDQKSAGGLKPKDTTAPPKNKKARNTLPTKSRTIRLQRLGEMPKQRLLMVHKKHMKYHVTEITSEEIRAFLAESMEGKHTPHVMKLFREAVHKMEEVLFSVGSVDIYYFIGFGTFGKGQRF